MTAADPALRVLDPVTGETPHDLPPPVDLASAPTAAPVAMTAFTRVAANEREVLVIGTRFDRLVRLSLAGVCR